MWKPVAYASHSMSETERRYAQIEKEALATTWACEEFSKYILGKNITIETDHKPLVPLLGSKNLDSLPPRVLRFRLRLARFDYSIQHIPGKHLYTADALSRAPTSSESDPNLTELAELAMDMCIDHLPASQERHRMQIPSANWQLNIAAPDSQGKIISTKPSSHTGKLEEC